MGELIAFCLIMAGICYGFALVVTIVGVVCILAKGALCALWHTIAR